MAAPVWEAMKSSASRGVEVPTAGASPSRRISSVRLQVQTGRGAEECSVFATWRRMAPTRCSSAERINVMGRPDWKISAMVLAALFSMGRLSCLFHYRDAGFAPLDERGLAGAGLTG